MKNPKKIVAAMLLIIGIGLVGAGVYLSYVIEEQTTCGSYLSEAKRKASAAQAAAGTPAERALKEDASIAMAGAESVCQYARQSKQNGTLMGAGGLIAIIISIVLLATSRKSGEQ